MFLCNVSSGGRRRRTLDLVRRNVTSHVQPRQQHMNGRSEDESIRLVGSVHLLLLQDTVLMLSDPIRGTPEEPGWRHWRWCDAPVSVDGGGGPVEEVWCSGGLGEVQVEIV